MPKRSRKNPDADIGARAELVRALAPIDECIRAAQADPALAGFSRIYLKLMVQRAQAELRAATGVLGQASAAEARTKELDRKSVV